jgi:hypothetical protein
MRRRDQAGYVEHQNIAIETGGLTSYRPNVPDTYRQLGSNAGRMLKGEIPSGLTAVHCSGTRVSVARSDDGLVLVHKDGRRRWDVSSSTAVNSRAK